MRSFFFTLRVDGSDDYDPDQLMTDVEDVLRDWASRSHKWYVSGVEVLLPEDDEA